MKKQINVRRLLTLMILGMVLLCVTGCAFDVGMQTQEKNGELKWPENGNTAGVPRPKFKNAEIVAVIDENDLVNVTYEGATIDEAKAYMQELKNFGFDGVESETISATTISFVARKDEMWHLMYNYSADGVLSVSLDWIGFG